MPSQSALLVGSNVSNTSSLLVTEQLDGPSRRLLKARSHRMDKVEIHTKTMTTILLCETMRFTVYKLQIRSTACFANSGESTLIKRYSEFFCFRQTLLKLLKKWDLQLRCDSEQLQNRERFSKEFELVSRLLLPALQTPTFPRKHMRSDTITIINERRKKLQQFVRTILDVYTDISLTLCDPQISDTRSFFNLNEIIQVVEEFMDISPQQKEINRRQTAAVLALEDVDKTTSDCIKLTCSICLSDEDPKKFVQERMVKLPCSHHFHEDCVIDWYNTSPTCPLCRQPALID
ncbi:kazal serine protease inhibitor 2 [Plasmopara halstedii]|uniref:Kazal serine protease inhibitor 2 n=1 Tax=Plasmopara halstedii TaxID=4781 RepID=A0A0P1AXH7_PLAHL|nr:kazal serine protease inhibitor 2 [Plasmopara halstedii]CEG46970.1 kazal serine protease inhibitor 2 [Plasmopara halstedii]|eukprot:XP_024583339.1 kazal serine protease inhibitor 2 [Plasmopara halstedii]